MNWLMEMLSEFSDKVMGESDVHERGQKSRLKKARERAYHPKTPQREKKRGANRFHDLDW